MKLNSLPVKKRTLIGRLFCENGRKYELYFGVLIPFDRGMCSDFSYLSSRGKQFVFYSACNFAINEFLKGVKTR